MNTNYQEEIRKLLDEAGLINKELTLGCIVENEDGEIAVCTSTGMLTYPNIIEEDTPSAPNRIIGHPWDLWEVVQYLCFYGNYFVTDHGIYNWDEPEMVQVSHVELKKPMASWDLKPLYELMLSLKK